MANKIEIKTMASRLFKGKRQPRDRQLMHPNREWFIGLCVALGILGVSGWWSANTYLNYQNVSIEDGGETTQSQVVYREAQVQAVLDLYTEKANTLTGLISEAPIITEEIEEESQLPRRGRA